MSCVRLSLKHGYNSVSMYLLMATTSHGGLMETKSGWSISWIITATPTCSPVHTDNDDNKAHVPSYMGGVYIQSTVDFCCMMTKKLTEFSVSTDRHMGRQYSIRFVTMIGIDHISRKCRSWEKIQERSLHCWYKLNTVKFLVLIMQQIHIKLPLLVITMSQFV